FVDGGVGDENVLIDLALHLEPRRREADRGVGHHVIAAAAVEDDREAAVLVRFRGARRLVDERSRGDGDVLAGLLVRPDDGAADDAGITLRTRQGWSNRPGEQKEKEQYRPAR